jgi:hypothetical protein
MLSNHQIGVVVKATDIIGTYDGYPIPAWVETPGRSGKYLFEGVAERTSQGTPNLQSLTSDDLIIEPGLLYRLEGAPPRLANPISRREIETTSSAPSFSWMTIVIGAILCMLVITVLIPPSNLPTINQISATDISALSDANPDTPRSKFETATIQFVLPHLDQSQCSVLVNDALLHHPITIVVNGSVPQKGMTSPCKPGNNSAVVYHLQ